MGPDRYETQWGGSHPLGAQTKAYWAQWKTLKLKDNILYRKWVEIPSAITSWLIIVPDQFKTTILQELHGTDPGGHLGRKKKQYLGPAGGFIG